MEPIEIGFRKSLREGCALPKAWVIAQFAEDAPIVGEPRKIMLEVEDSLPLAARFQALRGPRWQLRWGAAVREAIASLELGEDDKLLFAPQDPLGEMWSISLIR